MLRTHRLAFPAILDRLSIIEPVIDWYAPPTTVVEPYLYFRIAIFESEESDSSDSSDSFVGHYRFKRPNRPIIISDDELEAQEEEETTDESVVVAASEQQSPPSQESCELFFIPLTA